MTCEDCSHYDSINCFCWVRWIEIGHDEAYVHSCVNDDSKELEENGVM